MISYLLGLVTLGLISAVVAAGLNVRWGWAGEFDLSYYAFVAVGAYVAGVLIGGPSGGANGPVPAPNGWILGLHWPFLPSVVVTMLVCGALSGLIGAIALRKLRGDYFAIVTLAFTLLATLVLTQDFQLFNGFNGIFGVPKPFYDALNQPDFGTYNLIFTGICAVALVLVYVVLEALFNSPFGMTLRSIREDEQAAAAFGRNVYVNKLKAFVIGGMVAGLGGALYVVYLSSWNPSAWSPVEGLLLFAAIFVGGQGNNRGVILGVVIVLLLIPEATRWLPDIPNRPELFPALRNVVSGILILAILRWRPRGIIPEPHKRDLRLEEKAGSRRSWRRPMRGSSA